MKRIHFVGIKGVAMAALAVWYKEAGYKATGSDVAEEFPTDEILELAKIPVLPFDEANIARVRPDLVIYTGAHGGRENSEVAAAASRGIPVLPHGKALGEVMKGKRQISVAGSHGKTTTSAMIACMLESAGQDPSWAIGCGMVRGLGMPGHFGRGNLFVAEADEYITDPGHDQTPRFLWQHPDILVVTNIEYDHPDAYASIADVRAAFSTLERQSKVIIHSKDVQVARVSFGEERTFFTLAQHNMKLFDFTLKVPGRHNAQNAAVSAMVGRELGLSWETIARGLLAFGGTKRRFEKVAGPPDGGGATIIDDYAHHPSEIKATLAAARDWYPARRLIAVFQPHTYSRTQSLLNEFARAFEQADEVILTDIYASARETETLGISGKTLVEETAKYHRNVYFAPDYTATAKRLHAIMQQNDVILFMGAGDIYGWSKRFIKT